MRGPHLTGAMEGASVKLRGVSKGGDGSHLGRETRDPSRRGTPTPAVLTGKQYTPPALSVVQRLAL